jgi:glutamate synthase (NADPH/NADH) large chain/glutamate synthase (ferredoxin)
VEYAPAASLATDDQRRMYPLYDPSFERDSCGTGFIADVAGRRSHAVVKHALEALANLAHRGAMDADAETSDGAGILTQVPYRLLAHWLCEHGLEAPPPGALVVGMIFLPAEAAAAALCREALASALERRGVLVLAWRDVPHTLAALGTAARRTCPRIAQVLAWRPDDMDAEACERLLYLARKEAEHALTMRSIERIYVASLSARALVYKGLVAAANLPLFYPDLCRPEYESALALFHQRYSTNTFPSWPLAQPLRLLAHNGEINTIQANRHWMGAHEAELEGVWGADAALLRPAIEPNGSDSASLDNALELLVRSGRALPDALTLLVPEAWEGNDELAAPVRDLYHLRAPLMGPWDGPAALIFSDGRYAGAMLDRNGLRPVRYALTESGLLVVASETGVVDLPASEVVERGRLGPGQVLAVDTECGRLWHDAELKSALAARLPYGGWLQQHVVRAPDLEQGASGALDGTGEFSEVASVREADTRLSLLAQQTLFGYGHEDVELVLRPMAVEGAEAVWSMGDDTPLAVLSRQQRPMAAYFRQRFAQVTNPPIDSLRERLVMSLTTYLGARGSSLADAEPTSTLIELDTPVLDETGLRCVLQIAERHGISVTRLLCTYPLPDATRSDVEPDGALRAALAALEAAVVAAVQAGAGVVVLSDRECPEDSAPLPQPLAVAAAHTALLAAGLRLQTGLVVETGAAWDVHSIALLLGYGANAACPYLALCTASALTGGRGAEDLLPEQAAQQYRHAIEIGLRKVLARMGLSVLESYIGGQQFECIGLDPDLVDRYFPGTPTSLGGRTLADLDRQSRDQAAAARRLTLAERQIADTEPDREAPAPLAIRPRLADRGLVRFRKDGEYHAANPQVVKALQRAAQSTERADYDAYAALIQDRPPAALRDLLRLRTDRQPFPRDAVEPAEAIVARFVTTAMSLGSLSPEAHLALTLGANAVGARSNTGEGGEDPAWRSGMRDGVPMNSRIKQVASGRFGVTTGYLVCADELEIKMAQGSKPGEGGQLPGRKVTEFISRLRHTASGIQLISPPPHHDIYSIEDLAQLIYDLKQVNPRAAVGVKLVAERGVGTVAAGVAKAHADYILISGHDGGTGASPLSSIKYTGIPWELGLTEAQQVLRLNGLRERVRLRVDGGLKTGRDVVIAALLGADEFAFGTAALVAMGCDMARQCHLDTCPTGIATQREDLRRRFTGRPEHVARYLLAVAEEVRDIIATLGARSLDGVIGCSDLLTVDEARLASVAASGLAQAHLKPLVAPGDDEAPRRARVKAQGATTMPAEDRPLLSDAGALLERGGAVLLHHTISNRDRTVGARLAGEIAERWGDAGLPAGSIIGHYTGSAGQSFGAFCVPGLRLILVGDANDYVGKGMTGGEILIMPPPRARFDAAAQAIMGNTVLYGATGGLLLARGRAGERFAVRNSGAVALVEGVGDHGCEYMTGGVVVVLGPTGRNFAAGMSGGIAYVLDDEGCLPRRVNGELVALERIADGAEPEAEALAALIAHHRQATGSERAAALLADWRGTLDRMWRVRPRTLETVQNAVDAVWSHLGPAEGAASPLVARGGFRAAVASLA